MDFQTNQSAHSVERGPHGQAAAPFFGSSDAGHLHGAASAPQPLDQQAIFGAASQLFRAMDGLGTDEQAIHRALFGKTKPEIAALRTIYADHYPGHSLDEDLKSELSGTELEEAQAALSGDPIARAAAALRNASSGAGTDEKKIHETLAEIQDPAARAKLAAAYQRSSGQSLDAMLKAELSGSELRIAECELAGDRAGADALSLDEAMHGGFFGIGTDEEKIQEIFAHIKDQRARDRMLAAYEKETGRTLPGDLQSELSGAEKDLAESLISDGMYASDAQTRRTAMAQVAASRLAIASQGIGTDEEAIFKQFEGVSDPLLREEIKRAFNIQYGSRAGGRDFDAMLTSELAGNDLERARQVAKHGQMDPAFALKYALEGAGTDEDLIRETLKRCKNQQDIYALREKYAALQGKTDLHALDHDLGDELSGRDGFEVKQLMMGSATENLRPDQKIAYAEKAYEFERGHGAGSLGNFVTDLFSESGTMLDVQHARMQELDTKIKKGAATERDLKRLQTVSDYHKQDVTNYQSARDANSNTLALVGTTLVGTAATIASWGVAGPAVASVIGALAGGAAELGLKIGMQGESYSTEDFATDIASTLLSAAMAGASSSITQAAVTAASVVKSTPRIEQLVTDALKGGQSGLVSGTAAGLCDENTWRGSKSGAASFGEHLSNSMLGSMTSSVVSSGLSRLTGSSESPLSALGGVAGGAASGTVHVAIDGGANLSGDSFLDAFHKN